MTGHRALEKKQITQGNNRKVQNPGESLKEGTQLSPFFFCLIDEWSLGSGGSSFGSQAKVGFLCFQKIYRISSINEKKHRPLRCFLVGRQGLEP